MSTSGPGRANPAMLCIGIALIALAMVTYVDARAMNITARYGMGADAASYFVAAFLAILGVGHLVTAFRPADPVSHVDWVAVGWVGLGLACLAGAIGFGGGFILGSTLLFACTARAFGRKAWVPDLAIGFIIALVIFLAFNKFLKLALPMGPFERLF